MELYECVVCHNDLPEGRKLTCSHECYLIHQFNGINAKRHQIKAITAKCPFCGNTFRKRHPRRVFCSVKCHSRHIQYKAGMISGDWKPKP